MEQLPNPEELPIHLFVECDYCEEKIILEDENTIVFEAPDGNYYYYVQCNYEECDPSSGLIKPDLIQYFKDFTKWYDKEGNLISELRQEFIKGGAEIVEVKPEPTYEEKMFAFIEYIEPYEFSKRWLYK